MGRIGRNKLIEKVFWIMFVVLFFAISTINIVEQLNAQEYIYKQALEDYSKLGRMLAGILSKEEELEKQKILLESAKKENDLVFLSYQSDWGASKDNVLSEGELQKDLMEIKEEQLRGIRQGQAQTELVQIQGLPLSLMNIWIPVMKDNNTVGGMLHLAMHVNQNFIFEMYMDSVFLVIGSSIFWSLIISAIINANIAQPISLLDIYLEKISNYDLTEEKDIRFQKIKKRKDEIGGISRKFTLMQKSLEDIIRDISDISHIIKEQSEMLYDMSENASILGREMTENVNHLEQGATGQERYIREGKEQIHKLNGLVDVVDENSKNLVNSTVTAEKTKQEGLEALNDVVQNTEENNKVTAQVQEVIKEANTCTERIQVASAQIENIAYQTNLLALNASIEAARAGESGRGFTVVATQIGKLAGDTNVLTDQIRNVIKDLVFEMDSAVKLTATMQNSVIQQTGSVKNAMERFEKISDNLTEMEENCEKIEFSVKELEGSKEVLVDMISELSSISEGHVTSTQKASKAIVEEESILKSLAILATEVEKLSQRLTKNINRFIIE